jgi:hypothetical protein
MGSEETELSPPRSPDRRVLIDGRNWFLLREELFLFFQTLAGTF